tara:strand:- start:563 stop:814 length:252 start_codon:yes stop_codon:yes gene_type:complete
MDEGKRVLNFLIWLAFVILIIFIEGVLVMFLWNWVVVKSMKAPVCKITFWPAIGLVVLTNLLFNDSVKIYNNFESGTLSTFVN